MRLFSVSLHYGISCLMLLALSSTSGIALTSAANNLAQGVAPATSPSKAPFYTKLFSSSSGNDEVSSEELSNELQELQKAKKRPLKVLFLSADTGGGHRASAEALAAQFLIHFPGSTYDLLDVWTEDGCYPYKTLVNTYKHLSAHPRQWRFLYYMSNSVAYSRFIVWHSALICERKIRRRIAGYDPDVVVSVHPTMNGAPLTATKKISEALGKHIPFFTVVTDLGSGHTTWFSKHVEKLYIASEPIKRLAKRKGKAPEEILAMSGLPIRNAFAVEAEKLGDRNTPEGKKYQQLMREQLGINNPTKPMVMVMGGGEGVGSLESIVKGIYVALYKQGVDASIYVVCGRNEKLKNKLAVMDWEDVVNKDGKTSKRQRVAKIFGRRRKNKKILEALEHAEENEHKPHSPGKVDVIGMGYVDKMAEYMVATDILVTKAGPGTIAEAAAVGLPVMLTSFLPGQEAGNVDVVLDSGFGDYCEDPTQIGAEISSWLQDDALMKEMSSNARDAGHPHAAADIVLDIGTITNTWMSLNGENQKNSALTLKHIPKPSAA